MRQFFFVFLSFIVTLGCKSQAGSEFSAEQHGSVASNSIKAPAFEVVDLQGKKVSLSSLKGKVVFLDFWATWCPPCVISIPEVEKLHNEYQGKNLVIISISLDADPSSVKKFIDRHDMKNQVFMARNSGVDVKYRVEGIPAFYLIDGEGMLKKAWQGYHPSMPKIWRKEVDKLLAV